MTRRRRLLLFITGTALLTVIGGGSWLVYRAAVEPDPVRIYRRIDLGMSETEVARILEPFFTRRELLHVLESGQTILESTGTDGGLGAKD